MPNPLSNCTTPGGNTLVGTPNPGRSAANSPRSSWFGSSWDSCCPEIVKAEARVATASGVNLIYSALRPQAVFLEQRPTAGQTLKPPRENTDHLSVNVRNPQGSCQQPVRLARVPPFLRTKHAVNRDRVVRQ